MVRVFMVGYSENKGGVETYIDQLTAALPQFEFVYSLPSMEIGGKIWRRPPNRHRYLRYRLFWHRFFRKNRFDVLYYNACDVVSIDMLRFAKSAGIPVRIIHAHSSGTQQAINKKLSLFHRLSEQHNRKVLDKYATHFFACSRTAGEWMFDVRHYHVVKNGVQLAMYSFCEEERISIRESLGFEKYILVGIVGRLSMAKNPSFVVKILSSLIRKTPSAQAVFLGDGELRQQIELSVREAGLQNNVRFMGNVSNVNEWLSALDVLLMPSLFEGLPFVLVEAQANGLPCVVSSPVTREADMTGLVHYIDLSAPADIWADSILQHAGKRNLNTARLLASAGYDIAATAEMVAGFIYGKE